MITKRDSFPAAVVFVRSIEYKRSTAWKMDRALIYTNYFGALFCQIKMALQNGRHFHAAFYFLETFLLCGRVIWLW